MGLGRTIVFLAYMFAGAWMLRRIIVLKPKLSSVRE